MAELKTRETEASVNEFLKAIPDKQRRDDCFAIAALMEKVTRTPPRMWGSSIVGFGTYHYRYATGHEGDAPLTGFSPRKGALTLYVLADFDGCAELLEKLGTFKTGKSCLYIKKLADVDQKVLQQLIVASVRHMKTVNEPSG